jgi:2-iminobutanoate/2-iminopropanoate deaminase
MTTTDKTDPAAVALNQGPGLTFPGMSQAIKVGNLVFLAGQVALDDSGALVGEGDAHRQAERCFENIDTIARLAGGSLADVVRLTCYLADSSVYPDYAAVKAQLFTHNPPAATAVVVSALLDPRFLLEVEATLVLQPGNSTSGEPT